MSLHRSFAVPALLALLACGAHAEAIAVTATGGPDALNFGVSASTLIDILGPATIAITLNSGPLGCSPNVRNCPAYNELVQFRSEPAPKSSPDFAQGAVQWSTLGDGTGLVLSVICGGAVIFPSTSPVCSETIGPGVYDLSVLLVVRSTSLTSVVNPSSLTGVVTVVAGGPVVAAPEPATITLFLAASLLLSLCGTVRHRFRRCRLPL